MKVFLLAKDADFDLETPALVNESALVRDLELEKIFQVMSGGDKFIYSVVSRVMLASLFDTDAIMYRQEVLRECIDHPEIAKEIYDLAIETLTGINKVSFLGVGFFSKDNPEITLHRAVQQLKFLSGMLRKLWHLSDKYKREFSYPGFFRFFRMLREELDEEYFDAIDEHLEQLGFRDGLLISAELGEGLKGADYTLRKNVNRKSGWMQKISPSLLRRSANTIVIADRDEVGFKALEELRGRGINSAADAVARSSDHVMSFFSNLRFELAFYIGCLNLHSALAGKGEPTCFPDPLAMGRPALVAKGLYDPSLSLRLSGRCVGNDVSAESAALVMITGVNQGGKSTFVRSVGTAQLMMQAGMFVAASEFSADIRNGLFTHFKREEDKEMESGKLEEELVRMSEIVDQVSPGAMVIFNESFSSTNEREGSEIGRQLVRAMLESGIKVFFVTHFYDLATSFSKASQFRPLFMRANRKEDGGRSFLLVEGEPLPTVYGSDIYKRIFGVEP